jgi:hypothetical protein
MYQPSQTVEPKKPTTVSISSSLATRAVLRMWSVPSWTISSLSEVPAHSSRLASLNGRTICEKRWFESAEISSPLSASICLMPFAYEMSSAARSVSKWFEPRHAASSTIS